MKHWITILIMLVLAAWFVGSATAKTSWYYGARTPSGGIGGTEVLWPDGNTVLWPDSTEVLW